MYSLNTNPEAIRTRTSCFMDGSGVVAKSIEVLHHAQHHRACKCRYRMVIAVFCEKVLPSSSVLVLFSLLAFSPGLLRASPELLPSSFAMACVTAAQATWIYRRSASPSSPFLWPLCSVVSIPQSSAFLLSYMLSTMA